MREIEHIELGPGQYHFDEVTSIRFEGRDILAIGDVRLYPKGQGPISLHLMPLDSDPDLEPGGYLTLERADGRSVWRQRFVVVSKDDRCYVLKPVDEMHGYI